MVVAHIARELGLQCSLPAAAPSAVRHGGIQWRAASYRRFALLRAQYRTHSTIEVEHAVLLSSGRKLTLSTLLSDRVVVSIENGVGAILFGVSSRVACPVATQIQNWTVGHASSEPCCRVSHHGALRPHRRTLADLHRFCPLGSSQGLPPEP